MTGTFDINYAHPAYNTPISRNEQPLIEARVSDARNAAPDMERDRSTPLHEELRLLLTERRESARPKVTQEQLAARLGWGQQSISKIERGRTVVTVIQFIQIARALGFDPAAAIRRIDKRAAPEQTD